MPQTAEQRAAYYRRNREVICARNALNRKKTKAIIKARMKAYYAANKEGVLLGNKQWRRANRAKVLANKNQRFRKICEGNTDEYVRTQLAKDSPLSPNQFPQEIVDLKKTQIALRRILKTHENCHPAP